jgi:catechol 2,3-dioxygenase-like lactoylglutathione lyase family enzyme
MTIQRMDNVAIVVDDLDAAVAFFTCRAARRFVAVSTDV